MNIVTREAKQVARPLKVLAPLIKDDLQQGDEASERAGMPYYRAAGEKMWEAKNGSFHDSAAAFWDWVKRSFDLSSAQAKKYMDLAEAISVREVKTNVFNSLRESQKAIHPDWKHIEGSHVWQEPVKQAISSFNPESYARDLQNKAKERELERKLALTLIDIGFKVLTTKLHPDKRGGSDEAMSRLNNVRKRLKDAA